MQKSKPKRGHQIKSRVHCKVVVERIDTAATSRKLWKGLIGFNREQAGPLRHKRAILTVRDEKGRLLGGLIMQSWWQETYIELLWLATRARGLGLGSALIKEAERRAQRRGSRVIHLNTYSFQAPAFYESQGYKRFGTISGSPQGANRYLYLKRLQIRGPQKYGPKPRVRSA